MNDTHTNEEQLRAEIEALKRQLEEQKRPRHQGAPRSKSRPSTGTVIFLAALILVLIVAGFFAGYLPRQKREQVLAAGTQKQIRKASPRSRSRPCCEEKRTPSWCCRAIFRR